MSDSDKSSTSRKSRSRKRELVREVRRTSGPKAVFRKIAGFFTVSSDSDTDTSKMDSSSSTRIGNVDEVLSRAMGIASSNDEIRHQLEEVIAGVKDGLVDWINSHVAFSGFDAVEMRKKIVSKVKVGDIFLLIIIGLTRGNNVQRISTSMRNKTTKTHFDTLVKSLKIQKNVSGDYGIVTLSRVVSCFPDAVCQILHDHDIPMAVDYASLRKLYTEYPKIARHQVCASILSDLLSPEDKSKALTVIMVPYLMTSEVINSKNKTWKSMANKQKAEESEKYLINSYGSKILTSNERKELSIKMGIMINKTLTTVWAAAAVRAVDWLSSNYSYSIDIE